MSDSNTDDGAKVVEAGKGKEDGRVVTDRMHRAAMVYLSEQRVAVASQHVNGAIKAALAEVQAPAGFVALADLERMVDFGLSAHEVLESSRALASGGMLVHGKANGVVREG